MAGKERAPTSSAPVAGTEARAPSIEFASGAGAFADTFSQDYPYSDGTGKNTFSYAISGSLRKKTGSGKFSVHVVEADAAGSATSTCDTNSVKWSVSH